MGRALLFLTSGTFIIFGMIQLGVFDRQINIATINVEYVEAADARNTANAAIEMVLNELAADPTLRASELNPRTYQYGDARARVAIVDNDTEGVTLPPNIVEIRSRGEAGGNEAMAVARIEITTGLPEINGAMGIFTDNLDFNVSGSAFLISGHDVNPDGTPGTATSLPAIAVNTNEAFDEIDSSLNASQKSRLQGSGGTPSLELNGDMDGSALQDFVDKAVANADHIYEDYSASGVGSLGTPDDPKIIIVDGTLDVLNATGAGIIVIREGGLLDARGNFDNYQGIIIIQGKADMTRGNIHIVGAMLFGGSNPSIEIDIDFRGNINIQYSSSVLQNLSTNIPAAAGTRQRLLSIYD